MKFGWENFKNFNGQTNELNLYHINVIIESFLRY